MRSTLRVDDIYRSITLLTVATIKPDSNAPWEGLNVPVKEFIKLELFMISCLFPFDTDKFITYSWIHGDYWPGREEHIISDSYQAFKFHSTVES